MTTLFMQFYEMGRKDGLEGIDKSIPLENADKLPYQIGYAEGDAERRQAELIAETSKQPRLL
jgi:hypothetical protein